MKAVFKQSIRNLRFYIFLGCSLIVFGLALMDSKIFPFLILWIPILMIFKRSYTITDDDLLKGNGIVPIKTIRKLVRQSDSVVVYYLPENVDKMQIKPYFVKDRELFIEKLKEINSDIQVI